MRCLNCGLITRAKRRCRHCQLKPDCETTLTPILNQFSPKTRKFLLEMADNTMKSLSEDNHMSVDDLPLDLSSNSSPIESNTCPTKQENHENSVRNTNRGQNSVQMVGDWGLNNGMSCMSFPIELSVNYIRFGTYITSGQSFELYPNLLKLYSIHSNRNDNTFKFDIRLAFNQINQLMYCPNPCFPLICVKPNLLLAQSIQYLLNLGHNSHNGLVFDINSNGILLSNSNK